MLDKLFGRIKLDSAENLDKALKELSDNVFNGIDSESERAEYVPRDVTKKWQKMVEEAHRIAKASEKFPSWRNQNLDKVESAKKIAAGYINTAQLVKTLFRR